LITLPVRALERDLVCKIPLLDAPENQRHFSGSTHWKIGFPLDFFRSRGALKLLFIRLMKIIPLLSWYLVGMGGIAKVSLEQFLIADKNSQVPIPFGGRSL
jgi:hypothetical protein